MATRIRNPQKFVDKAVRHHQRGDYKSAEKIYRKLLAEFPEQPKLHVWIGAALRKLNKFEAAIEHIQTAIALEPTDFEAHHGLGGVLHDQGRFADAEACYRRAMGIFPMSAQAANNLGCVLQDQGKTDDSLEWFSRALQIDPNLTGAYYNMASAAFDDRSLAAADAALQRALQGDREFQLARVHLGIVKALQGDRDAAESLFEAGAGDAEAGAVLDSWRYIEPKMTEHTRMFGNTFETLKFGLDNAPSTGMVLELGVNFGESIRFIGGLIARDVHGFDSFEGLPEGWTHEQAGSYSTMGTIPPTPPNVHLHKGWFSDTLPAFAEANPGPVAFMNVDCDIYSSTKTVFESLAGQIVAGTVIVFDEYIANPSWRDDEFKAFQEFIADGDRSYEYLAFAMFSKQAVVRML